MMVYWGKVAVYLRISGEDTGILEGGRGGGGSDMNNQKRRVREKAFEGSRT